MANKKKTNGKDPAVLLYTQDFIVGTITMTHEQRGKYIMLLCLQHQKGKLTLNDLRQYLNEEDFSVAEKFTLNADGFYYNNRMQMEIENRKVRTDTSRTNGALGGRPKTTILPNDEPKDNPQVINGLTQIKPNNNPSGNGNEIEDVNDNVNTEVVYTQQMIKNMIEKFAEHIDNRFKLNHFLIEIDEDWGGWDNFLEIAWGDDTSVKNNFNNKLNQYRNGIFK
jgi:hypothetical protein